MHSLVWIVLLLALLLQLSSCQYVISTIAGTAGYDYNGDQIPATSATLHFPVGVALDATGNSNLFWILLIYSNSSSIANVYIADQYNHRIRKVTIVTGIISTIAGTGISSFSGDGGDATSATLFHPYGVALDSSGNVYIADAFNHRIRKVAVTSGIISTVAGNGGTGSFSGDNGLATSATLNRPQGVTLDASGNIFIADTFNSRIRKVTISLGTIITFAGIGTAGYSGDGLVATAVQLNHPSATALDASGCPQIHKRNHRSAYFLTSTISRQRVHR